jgi:Rieske Fe-S protein
METDRRGALGLLGKGLAAAVAAGAALLGGRFVLPRRVQDLDKLLVVGPARALARGTSRYLDGPDVHVIHEDAGAYAVSGRCTHLGCSLLRQPEGFTCPCHGARFTLHGKPTGGPATRNLTWHKLTVDHDGRILVHLDETVAPGTLARI